MQFGKFPIGQHDEFIIRYYDTNSHTFYDVGTEEALAMMWSKHLDTGTMLMFVHIVNKDTGEETILNDTGPCGT